MKSVGFGLLVVALGSAVVLGKDTVVTGQAEYLPLLTSGDVAVHMPEQISSPGEAVGLSAADKVVSIQEREDGALRTVRALPTAADTLPYELALQIPRPSPKGGIPLPPPETEKKTCADPTRNPGWNCLPYPSQVGFLAGHDPARYALGTGVVAGSLFGLVKTARGKNTFANNAAVGVLLGTFFAGLMLITDVPYVWQAIFFTFIVMLIVAGGWAVRTIPWLQGDPH